MAPRLLHLAGALLLASATQAQALPIDCSKAAKPDERTLCADPFLLQTDARLDTLYDISLRLVPMGTRGDLVESQRAWVKERANCRTDRNCLRAAYAKRSAVFEGILKRVEEHGPF